MGSGDFHGTIDLLKLESRRVSPFGQSGERRSHCAIAEARRSTVIEPQSTRGVTAIGRAPDLRLIDGHQGLTLDLGLGCIDESERGFVR